MKKDMQLLLCIVLVVVLMNLLVPLIVKQFANNKQKAGPVNKLNLLDQFVHLCVQNSGAPLSSSIAVFIFVGLSVLIARSIC